MVSLIQILCYRLLEKCQNWLCIYHVHAYCHTNTLEGWIVRLVSAVDTVSLLLYMFRALFVCLSPSLSQISFRVYSWKVAQVEFTYIYIYIRMHLLLIKGLEINTHNCQRLLGMFVRYPSDADKLLLSRQTGLSRNQVHLPLALSSFRKNLLGRLYLSTHFFITPTSNIS